MKTNDNQTIQYKEFRGELHVRIGFGEWMPANEVKDPKYIPTEPTGMDFSRAGDSSKSMRPSIQEVKVTGLKNVSKFWY